MMTVSASVNLYGVWDEDLVSVDISAITCAPLNDVCDGARKHLETLRHLKSDHVGSVLANMVYRLVDFKRIVGG